MTKKSTSTLLLPKEVDGLDPQKYFDENPELGKALTELQSVAALLTPAELKFSLAKLGVEDDSALLTFREFVEFVLEGYEEMCEVYDLHEEWIRVVETDHPDDNVLFFAPVDSWKSTFLAAIYPLYLMYITKGKVRIGVFSATESLSKKRIIQCKEVIEGNEKLQALGVRKPKRALDWGELSFTIKRDGVISGSTMAAFGIGGQSQGFKFDVIILDDVVNLDNSRTETNRKNLEDKYRREVISRLTKRPPAPLTTSRAIAVCTALHKDDLNHKLERGFDEGEPTFITKRYLAIYEGADLERAPEFVKKQKYVIKDHVTGIKRRIGLVFPERLSYQYLMTVKRGQGPKFFAQNYQQQPLSDDDYVISPEYIINCFDPRYKMGPALWFSVFAKQDFRLFFVIDPAIIRSRSEAIKKDSDYAVIEARAYSPTRDLRVILDFMRDRGISKAELIQRLIDMYNSFREPAGDPKFRVSNFKQPTLPTIFIEQVGAQEYLIEDIENIFGKSHVRGLKTTHISKNDGFTGLPAVAYAYERSAVLIPTGDARSRNFADVLLDEASNYAHGTGHDDVFMCELLNEQAISQLRGKVQMLDPNLLGIKQRGARNFQNLQTPRQRYRSRQPGGMRN